MAIAKGRLVFHPNELLNHLQRHLLAVKTWLASTAHHMRRPLMTAPAATLPPPAISLLPGVPASPVPNPGRTAKAGLPPAPPEAVPTSGTPEAGRSVLRQTDT